MLYSKPQNFIGVLCSNHKLSFRFGEDWEERIDPSKLGNQLLLEHYPSDLEIEGVIPSES